MERSKGSNPADGGTAAKTPFDEVNTPEGAPKGGSPVDPAAALARFNAVAETWRKKLIGATVALPPDEQLLAELAAGEVAHIAALGEATRALHVQLLGAKDNPRKATAIAEALNEVARTGAVLQGRVERSLAAAAALRLNRQLVELQRRTGPKK